MKKRIVVTGLAMALAGFAYEASFKKTRLQTVEKSKEKFTKVELRVGDEKITVADKKSSTILAEIPYTQIQGIFYEMSKRRRLAEGGAVMALSMGAGGVLMLTKSKSHWLTIQHDRDGTATETVLQLHKDEYGPVIAAIEAKNGKQVEILTDQESKVNPTDGSKNIDEVVPYSVEQVRVALKLAMEKFGCAVTNEKDNQIECKRARVNNEATGVGGEKVTAKLKTERESTKVKIETGKGFYGRLNKRNWSTPIFEEMEKNLLASSSVASKN